MSDSIRDLHALIDRRIALSTGSAPPVELVRGVVARVDGTRCEAYLDGAASTTPGITVPRGVHTYPGDEVLVSRRRDGFLVISDVLDLSAVDVAPTVRVYTASAEWVKPERIHHIVVEVQGAGGGGGGTGWTNTNGSAESGGGGGGGYARKLLTAADLASASAATVTVGTGGSGGTGGNNGSAGNASSFAGTGFTTVSGGGGSGGSTGPDSANWEVAGGNGGDGSGGDINRSGAAGDRGTVLGGVIRRMNAGGASALGPRSTLGGNNANGTGGVAYGGGGSGCSYKGIATTNLTGGAGANGVVIVTEYYA
jgi:hypothetical protein